MVNINQFFWFNQRENFPASIEELGNVARTLLILPKIKIYMEAGYSFENAHDRIIYLIKREQKIKHQNLHQE
jgi:hypothetical protein